MTRFSAAVALLLSLVACAAAPAFAWDSPAMNRQIDQTNFLVNDNCSATLIDAKRGYLITANHCIADQFRTIEREKIDSDGKVTTEKVRVSVPGTVSQLFFRNADEVQRNSYVFSVKQNDADTDLALIQVKASLSNSDAAPIACNNAERGDVAFAVGNPMGILYSSVSKGIVASTERNYRMIGVDGDAADHGLVQTTTPIGGGNSGGSLYNDKGEIIGVVVRGYQAIAPIALSVPLSDIKKFLTREKLESLWSRCGGDKK